MRKDERGAVLVLFALSAAALILMTGLAANVGMMVFQRTRMQAAADAAALAGACSLDFGDQAGVEAAKLYAQQNGFPIQDSDVSVLDSTRVTVHMTRPMEFFLADFLQDKSAAIGATSSADFKPISRGVRPLGIPQSIIDGCVPYVPYALKYGSGGGSQGNFQALDLSFNDPSGASTFENYFIHGSEQPCNSPAVIPTKTGNMANPTERAAVELIDRKPQVSYAQVLEESKTNTDAIERYPRVITVVIIKDFAVNGKSDVDVVGFARFYLDSAKGGAVNAFFIDASKNLAQKDKTKYHARLVM